MRVLNMKIEYINDDIKNGIKYDNNLVSKEYKRLKCPKDVYNPLHIPINSAKWFVLMSERARGKTTNVLLLGMIYNKLYGTEIQYLRTREDMITPKNSKDLFKTIIEYGYVEKVTDGEYNSIQYKSRRWYYAYINEDGEEEKRSIKPFCTMLSIDKAETYKSAYNAPLGDFIVFDEFIERFYQPQQFLMLIDLISTIARQRQSVMIFMLANTIDRNTPYFNELEIIDELDDMAQGDNKIITTKLGTNIYVEILGKRKKESGKLQTEINKLYYGFSNKKISSVTGADTWAVSQYPHTPKDFRILNNHHYIDFNHKLICLEICYDKTVDRHFINCHLATKIYDDSIIYTLDFPKDKRYKYKFGHNNIDKFIFKMYDRNLFTYSDNSVGALVEKYILQALKS